MLEFLAIRERSKLRRGFVPCRQHHYCRYDVSTQTISVIDWIGRAGKSTLPVPWIRTYAQFSQSSPFKSSESVNGWILLTSQETLVIHSDFTYANYDASFLVTRGCCRKKSADKEDERFSLQMEDNRDETHFVKLSVIKEKCWLLDTDNNLSVCDYDPTERTLIAENVDDFVALGEDVLFLGTNGFLYFFRKGVIKLLFKWKPIVEFTFDLQDTVTFRTNDDHVYIWRYEHDQLLRCSIFIPGARCIQWHGTSYDIGTPTGPVSLRWEKGCKDLIVEVNKHA